MNPFVRIDIDHKKSWNKMRNFPFEAIVENIGEIGAQSWIFVALLRLMAEIPSSFRRKARDAGDEEVHRVYVSNFVHDSSDKRFFHHERLRE